MKPSLKLLSTLLTLGLPITAQAECDSYMNSEHGLTLPATVIVPDNLPVGGEILRKAFNGVGPRRFMYCPTANIVSIYGRYSGLTHPPTQSYRTEAPGVGIKIRIADARGFSAFYGLLSATSVQPAGTHPYLTNAEAVFIKTGPVTGGTVPAATIFSWTISATPGVTSGRFLLRQDNAVRFITPNATCDLAAGDVNRTVSLDPIQVSALQNATTAGDHDFELTANCKDASTVTFSFSGAPAPGNDRLFANTGTAGGVALWLYSRLNGGKQNILANGTQNTRTLVVSGNRAVLPLGAAYHKNGTVSQGTLVSTATVNITYN
ncbi:fimbrial protein [Pseudomonas poae]|uniref:Fimbrial protein n=1 Tax=Pseudomonas poae TaxID=200451 RepID=A0A2S9EYP9_9PSED|nr:fimbrial protein [Pseudomonas poae]PRA30384.1 fimbrial protein [Pseudomonas poae]PRC22268.1 fimbrial protein [Pseudomonas poae]